jgi:hypothetical protein
MTPPRHAGESQALTSSALIRDVKVEGTVPGAPFRANECYRPVSAIVSRTGIFNALHRAVRLVSRGRTRPLSQ